MEQIEAAKPPQHPLPMSESPPSCINSRYIIYIMPSHASSRDPFETITTNLENLQSKIPSTTQHPHIKNLLPLIINTHTHTHTYQNES